MLIFENPVWLSGLFPVAIIAAWTLFRPARQLAVVGSLELWQEALDHLASSRRLRSRRISLSWLLLLLGASAAIAAAARPTWHFSAPARRVAVALYPSAEIARKKGMDDLRQTANTLLDRLSPDDRVQVLLPDAGAGSSHETGAVQQHASSRWLSVSEARSLIYSLRPYPVAADDLALPAAEDTAQHIYRLAPAGAGIAAAPGEAIVEVPSALPDVTLDALAAAVLPDGNVQVFASFHNHTQTTLAASLSRDPNGIASPDAALPSGTTSHIWTAPPADWARIDLSSNGHSRNVIPSAFLAARAGLRTQVALVGVDEPLVRRFVKVNRHLALVADPADADVLVCVAQAPPPGRPALVIAPPSPPTGCEAGHRRENVALGGAGAGVSINSQDPLMRHVDLSGVAVRSMAPWKLGGDSDLKALCSIGGEAIIARTTPELSPAGQTPRRVYLTFATDAENTGFGTSESFVIFLANAFEWLGEPGARSAGAGTTMPARSAGVTEVTRPETAVPGGTRPALARYEWESPAQAAFASDWKPVMLAPPFGEPWAAGPYPAPGVYTDGRGGLHAVSLVGLKGGAPAVPPRQAVAAAPLPPPAATGTTHELWPWLALAAMALWLAGWAARTRT